MDYLIAISSSDGVMIQQHFGRTESFQIWKVEDNQRYSFVADRLVAPPCREGEHDDAQLARAVEALTDCKYVLSAKIGMGAQAALQSRGVTPLEISHFVDYAIEKVMLYDQKFKQERRK